MTTEELLARVELIKQRVSVMRAEARQLESIGDTPSIQGADFTTTVGILNSIEILILTNQIRAETTLPLIECIAEIQADLIKERLQEITANPLRSQTQ